jgi:hypothetical protein
LQQRQLKRHGLGPVVALEGNRLAGRRGLGQSVAQGFDLPTQIAARDERRRDRVECRRHAIGGGVAIHRLKQRAHAART